MKFKKITDKPTANKDTFDINDIKMVKLSFIFPVWKDAKPKDIFSEFTDSDIYSIEKFDIEEATPSVKDLETFQNSFDGDWYFYHREKEITLKQIISNSKKNKNKK